MTTTPDAKTLTFYLVASWDRTGLILSALRADCANQGVTVGRSMERNVIAPPPASLTTSTMWLTGPAETVDRLMDDYARRYPTEIRERRDWLRAPDDESRHRV